MAKEKIKKKIGRKWFDGKDEAKVISEIKYIWGIGGTDTEAASYADISNASLSRYIDAHPELAEIRNRLQEKPFIYARQTIVKAIKENPQAAFEYMKRKKKDEFGDSQKIEHSGEGGFTLNIKTINADKLDTNTETSGGVEQAT